MSETHDTVLVKVRTACAAGMLPCGSPEHPGSAPGSTAIRPADELASQFAREVEALGGHLHVAADEASLLLHTLDILRQHDCREVLSWDAEMLPATTLLDALPLHGIRVVRVLGDPRQGRADARALAGIGAGLTGARAALADTGSVVVTSGPGRSRLASLLPAVHVAIVPQHVLYPSLSAFLDADPDAVGDGSNLVAITGPSRTADIEMTLTHGVHGPRALHVILLLTGTASA